MLKSDGWTNGWKNFLVKKDDDRYFYFDTFWPSTLVLVTYLMSSSAIHTLVGKNPKMSVYGLIFTLDQVA